MNSKEYKTQISYLLRNNNGRLIDIAYKASSIIEGSGELGPKLLQFFFEEEFSVTKYLKTEEKEIISDKELEEHIEKYANKVWSWLDTVLETRPTTTKFYEALYTFLYRNKEISTKKIRSFFLLSVWIDNRIPYSKPEKGITLCEEEFIRIFENISKTRAKAKTIVYTKYSTRTEEASVLMKLFEGLSSPEEKAVLLAYIINTIETRTRDQLSEKKEENND